MMNEVVATELKNWFKKHGKANADVALDLDVSVQFVSMIVNGKKSIGKELAERLSNQYGLSKAFLLTGCGNIDDAESRSKDGCLSIDQGSLMNAALAAKDETIQALHDQIDTKNELIDSLRQHLSDLRDKMHYGHSEYGRKGMMASEDLGDV